MPVSAGDEPAFDGAEPVSGGDEPAFGGAEPVSGGDEPAFGVLESGSDIFQLFRQSGMQSNASYGS